MVTGGREEGGLGILWDSRLRCFKNTHHVGLFLFSMFRYEIVLPPAMMFSRKSRLCKTANRHN